VALPTVIAKNQTGTPILLPRLGLTCPATPGTITLTDFANFYEVSSEEVLNTRVTAGDIVINDGTSDLSTGEAIAYLDATGNLNGPVTAAAAGKVVRLVDATGRYTEAANVKMYDQAAVDPVAPAPADGDMYYNTALNMWMAYDNTRGKWLSMEGDTFQVGQNGNVPVGTYYKGVAGKTLSAALGYTAPYNGTIITVTFTQTNADDTDFEIMASGVQIGTSNTGGATSGFDNAIDADFSQGDILAIRNDAAGVSTRDAQCWVRMKWRV
jgi:hypothetical protein